jgi:hypothetical protein
MFSTKIFLIISLLIFIAHTRYEEDTLRIKIPRRFISKTIKTVIKKNQNSNKSNNKAVKQKNCKESNGGDKAGQIGGKIAGKIASRVAGMAFGAPASAVVGGLTLALGFIGDFVQRDKCKLLCCPTENLRGSWACKYQGEKTCEGSYSDYPGHGDHACWWNKEAQRCEVGQTCRDKTFNFFAVNNHLK